MTSTERRPQAGAGPGVEPAPTPPPRSWWQLPAERGAWVRPFHGLTWREAPAAAAAYLRSAPGTVTYLFTIFITTVSLRDAGPRLTTELMRRESTNVHNMLQNPIRVLLASAFWLDANRVPVTLVLFFLVVMAPTERRIGTARWLGVGAAGHVGATILTTIGINFGVNHHLLRSSLTHTVDVGISYFAMAVAAVFVSLLPGWLPWLGRALIAAYVIANVIAYQTFTDYGHVFAACIGFALAPIATRGASWYELHRPRARHVGG